MMILSLLHVINTGSGAHPAFYTVGTWGSFMGVNQPKCEAGHSPPTPAEVKETQIYPPAPFTRLHGSVLN
jgi:hypothetical protein